MINWRVIYQFFSTCYVKHLSDWRAKYSTLKHHQFKQVLPLAELHFASVLVWHQTKWQWLVTELVAESSISVCTSSANIMFIYFDNFCDAVVPLLIRQNTSDMAIVLRSKLTISH